MSKKDKDYGYAYKQLQMEGAPVRQTLLTLDPVILLAPYLPGFISNRFNEESLDALNSAIYRIEEYKDEQTFLSFERPDEAQDIGGLDYLLLQLKRYKDNFEWLLKDVYKDIKALCEKNDSAAVNSLLLENSWMSDILSFNQGKLGFLAAQNDDRSILEVLYSRSLGLKSYSNKLLETAVTHNKLDCIQYLLAQGVDPMPLLEEKRVDSGDFYRKHAESIKQCTDYLSSNGKQDYGNCYEGISQYKNGEYKAAIKLLEGIKDASLAPLSLLYQGYCYQYSSQYANAKKCFEAIVRDTVDHDTFAKVQEHIRYISSLEGSDKKCAEHQGEIDGLLKTVKDNLVLSATSLKDRLEPQVSKFMEAVKSKNSVGVTESYKELNKLLNEIKYIEIVKAMPLIVHLAFEFADVPTMAKGYSDQCDASQLSTYSQAYSTIDGMLELIGTISTGMLVD